MSARPPALDQALARVAQYALRTAGDIVALALGDHQGLPIVNATPGRASVMTFTAMSTMTLASARTAAKAVGLPEPEYLAVYTPGGLIVILNLLESRTTLLAILRAGANLGMALLVLRDVGRRFEEALRESR